MDDGLLALKWNNHRSTFFHLLSQLRWKDSYTDATLACEGKFFAVHKLVLSSCSDYFCEVFERTSCKAPVVILKDMRQKDLECLLSYMYLGEVEIQQTELPSLIKAAESLQIKGLAAPDKDHSPAKRKLDESTQNTSNYKKANCNTGLNASPHPEKQSANQIAVENIKVEDLECSGELASIEKYEDYTLNNQEPSADIKLSGNFDAINEKTEEMDITSVPGPSGLHEGSSMLAWEDDSLPFQESTNDILNQRELTPRLSTVGKRHKCSACPYTTNLSGNLRRHLLIHTGEKPYKCSRCPYRANQAVTISKHELFHCRERPEEKS